MQAKEERRRRRAKLLLSSYSRGPGHAAPSSPGPAFQQEPSAEVRTSARGRIATVSGPCLFPSPPLPPSMTKTAPAQLPFPLGLGEMTRSYLRQHAKHKSQTQSWMRLTLSLTKKKQTEKGHETCLWSHRKAVSVSSGKPGLPSWAVSMVLL